MGIFNDNNITIFNKYTDLETGYDIWLATHLGRVNLVITKGANVSTSGMADADGAKVFMDTVGATYDSYSKKYISPKEWQRLSAEEKENYFTFTPAQDFFVEGDYTELDIAENIRRSAFYEYMKENYDNVYKVSNVDIYSDIMPHLEIGGV